MLGLLNVQGTVQAIVDLGAFLGLGATAPGDAARLVFVERDEIRVGLLVDGASGIRYLDARRLQRRRRGRAARGRDRDGQRAAVRVLDGSALIDALVRVAGAAPGKRSSRGAPR